MFYVFAAFLVLLLNPTVPSFLQDKDPIPETGILEVDPEELDFGRVFDGAEPIASVTLRNRGKDPLTIKRISSSCGCAVPRVVFPDNQEVIIGSRASMGRIGVLLPGQEARMDVTFRTQSYKGKLEKQILIETDEQEKRVHRVKVLAMIIDSIAFTPKILDLGSVIRGQRISKTIRLKSVGIGDFDVKGIRNLLSYLTFRKEKLTGGPNAEVALQIGTREDVPLGKLFRNLTVDIENEYIDQVRFRLEAQVLPKVRFELNGEPLDDEVDFGAFSRRKGQELTVEIVNLAPGIPYEPLDITVKSREALPFIEKRLEVVEPGLRYALHLKVKAGVRRLGFLRGKVEILSDHPDLPQKTFYLSGWVRE